MSGSWHGAQRDVGVLTIMVMMPRRTAEVEVRRSASCRISAGYDDMTVNFFIEIAHLLP
jgi:hypothetical protein